MQMGNGKGNENRSHSSTFELFTTSEEGGRGVLVLTHAVLFAPAVVAVVFCFVCISKCHLPGRGSRVKGERGEGLQSLLLCIW